MITDVKELKGNLTLLTPNNEAEVAIDGIGCMSNLGDDNNGKQGNEGNLVLNNPSTSFSGDENSQQVVVEDGQSSLELVERHLNTHYDFRYNQVSGKVHFKKKDSNEYGNMTDYQFNSIVRELKKKQINVSKDTLNSVIHSDFVPAFNPFLDYFNGLPIWDGSTDYIQQLVDTVNTENDELWSLCFKKWIVATVGCATVDSITNQTAIIFVGNQGVGKTRWMKRLVPLRLENYFYSGIPNLKDKDSKIRLSECFLINMDEMDNLAKHHSERLKEMITKASIRERRPYGRNDELMPRRASFMGSVNSRQFLNDPTGTRRYLCFEVSRINNEHDINMDYVYAQAKYLFEHGFQYWFDTSETVLVTEHNTQFEIVSYVEDLIKQFLEPVNIDQEEPQYKWTTTEITKYLSEKSALIVNDSNIQKVGKFLKKLNYTKVKENGVYAHAVKEKGAAVQNE